MRSRNEGESGLVRRGGSWVVPVVVWLLLTACGASTADTPVSTSTVAATAPPTTVTVTRPATTETSGEVGAPPNSVPVVELPGIVWRRVDIEGGLGLDLVEKAIPLADCSFDGECGPIAGYVAVGSGYDDFERAGIIWLSDDGDTWERVAVFGGEDEYHIFDVAYRDGTLVAVGGIDPTPLPDLLIWGTAERYVPKIWTSFDLGRTWALVADGADLIPTPFEGGVHAVAATDEGFVAGGWDGFWFSPDGTRWEHLEISGGSEVPPPGDRWGSRIGVHRIVRWSGGFVAISQMFSEQHTWTSSNGIDWEEHPGVVLVDDGFLLGVVEGPGEAGLLGVGFTFPTDDGPWDSYPAVWRSANGAEWSAVPKNPEWLDQSGMPMQGMHAVGRVGEWLIAVGDSHYRSETESIAMMWVSSDGGETWSTLPVGSELVGRYRGPSSRFLDVVTTRDPEGMVRIIVSGFYGDEAAIWIGESTSG